MSASETSVRPETPDMMASGRVRRATGPTGAGMRRRGEAASQAVLAPSGMVYISGPRQAVEEAVAALCGAIDGAKAPGYSVGPGVETGVLDEEGS